MAFGTSGGQPSEPDSLFDCLLDEDVFSGFLKCFIEGFVCNVRGNVAIAEIAFDPCPSYRSRGNSGECISRRKTLIIQVSEFFEAVDYAGHRFVIYSATAGYLFAEFLDARARTPSSEA